MSTQAVTPNVKELVPRGLAQPHTSSAPFTPQAASFVPQGIDSFTGAHANYKSSQSFMNPATPTFNPKLQTPAPAMPEMKMNFSATKAPVFERHPSFKKEPQPFYPSFASTLGQRQCSS